MINKLRYSYWITGLKFSRATFGISMVWVAMLGIHYLLLGTAGIVVPLIMLIYSMMYLIITIMIGFVVEKNRATRTMQILEEE